MPNEISKPRGRPPKKEWRTPVSEKKPAATEEEPEEQGEKKQYKERNPALANYPKSMKVEWIRKFQFCETKAEKKPYIRVWDWKDKQYMIFGDVEQVALMLGIAERISLINPDATKVLEELRKVLGIDKDMSYRPWMPPDAPQEQSPVLYLFKYDPKKFIGKQHK